MLRRFLGENSINTRGFLLLTILFISFFGWYYMTQPLIEGILTGINPTYSENLLIWATFYLSIIGASILGTFVSKKVSRLKFLYTWIILGTIISLLPALLANSNIEQIWAVSLLLGASFGIGIPSFLAYFAECTVVENRGRIGGVTFLIANISGPLLVILLGNFDLVTFSVLFVLLRAIGLLIFFLNPEKQCPSPVTKNVSFMSVLRDRTFLIYFVAWSMFPLIDGFEKALVVPYLTGFSTNLFNAMGVVEPLVASFSILIAGLLCDWIGRKKIAISGFVAIGAGYGIIGLFSTYEFSWYLYFIADGIAWGIFLLMFVLILWGDIANLNNSEKYYTIGSIPYILSSIIPIIFTQTIVEGVDVTSAFSLAALFLFAAMMPLAFAPETLPEKKMELRRLRSFAEDAKKIKEKYERKMEK
ncbi:MAG: hypothetical protein CW691_00510 [Candidatus Bathyarchaeum sp.]|nr:MAG: hypothetical protein CW691_00510 [Candidatus Bathyarchaeum sp.]